MYPSTSSTSTITYALMTINSVLVVWHPPQAIYFTDYYTSLSEEPTITRGKNIYSTSPLQSFQHFFLLLSAISICSLISIDSWTTTSYIYYNISYLFFSLIIHMIPVLKQLSSSHNYTTE